MFENQIGPLFGGRYNVVKSIGAGGMGAVYLATDARYHDFEVAIKILYPGIVKTKELRERFKNEIIASYNVLHRNVVRAYEFYDEEDSPAYVMEYVKGEDLHTRISKGEISSDEAIRILYQAAAGLDAIHSAGIMHRDLKPENIFLTKAGSVKIGDFGVARIKSENDSVTQAGMLVGTPKYFAPEYVEFGTCDARADIYALGVIAYELITGKSPFRSKTATSLMIERFENKVTPIRNLVPNCPPQLIRIVEKAMAVSVTKRYQKAGEMRTDLGLLLKGEDLAFAAKDLIIDRAEAKHNAKAIKGIKQKNTKGLTTSSGFRNIVIVSCLLLLILSLGGYFFFINMHTDDKQLVRGYYRGFLIDGSQYRAIEIQQTLDKTFVTVKSLFCNNVLLDENNIANCEKDSYLFKAETVKEGAASGILVLNNSDLQNSSEKQWSVSRQ